MEVIYRERHTGRTTTLIRLSAEEGGYMVVHSHDEAYRVAREAETMGLSIPFPLNYSEFLNKRYYGAGVKQLFIDNADYLLQHMAIVPVAAVVLERREGSDA